MNHYLFFNYKVSILIFFDIRTLFRSTRLMCSIRKMLMCAALLKGKLRCRCFPVRFVIFLTTSFCIEQLCRLLLSFLQSPMKFHSVYYEKAGKQKDQIPSIFFSKILIKVTNERDLVVLRWLAWLI